MSRWRAERTNCRNMDCILLRSRRRTKKEGPLGPAPAQGSSRKEVPCRRFCDAAGVPAGCGSSDPQGWEKRSKRRPFARTARPRTKSRGHAATHFVCSESRHARASSYSFYHPPPPPPPPPPPDPPPPPPPPEPGAVAEEEMADVSELLKAEAKLVPVNPTHEEPE